jgi:hypothetical protein
MTNTNTSERAKLTKAERKALDWFASRDEAASQFGVGDPSLPMVKRLRDRGLVCHAGTEPGFFGFVRYEISHQGRAALSKAST